MMPNYRFLVNMMKRKVGVVLSGCGFLDGADFSEDVLNFWALDSHDLQEVCMTPNDVQDHVVDEDSVVDACVIDEANRIVSTAAFMCDVYLDNISGGIHALVGALQNLPNSDSEAQGINL
jgi:enhancing lycopene biosynthesis protein 2